MVAVLETLVTWVSSGTRDHGRRLGWRHAHTATSSLLHQPHHLRHLGQVWSLRLDVVDEVLRRQLMIKPDLVDWSCHATHLVLDVRRGDLTILSLLTRSHN